MGEKRAVYWRLVSLSLDNLVCFLDNKRVKIARLDTLE